MSLTTKDFKPGTDVVVVVPGTRIEMHGVIVDPCRTIPSDHVAIRYAGECAAFDSTPIAAIVGTYA